MTPNGSLSIVVPAYHERVRIAGTIERLAAHFSPRFALEVIVVDDGSRDGTAEAVAAQSRRWPVVRLLRLERNCGKGAAVRRGMLEASGAIRCFCDADLATPVEDMERVVRAVEAGADVAIASRALAESTVVASHGVRRAVLSRMFNEVVRRGLGLPFRDTQCGCKAFRGPVAQEVFERLRTPGFVFDVELLLIARRLGRTITEVPVRFENSSLSTVRLMAHAGSICRDLVRLLWTRC